MNKIKSLLLFCMVFAFAAFPLSNQGFCNGDPIIDYYLADCTATITSTMDDCTTPGSYTLTITVTTTNADDVDIALSDGQTGNFAFDGTGTATATFTIMGGPNTITITATSNGAGCTTPATGTTGSHTSTCTSPCQNCFAGNADIQDANGYPMEGGEVCGTTTELFEVGLVLNCDGMIGSAALPNRNVTFEFGDCANLVAGFEVFAGSEFLCTNAPISCVPFTENDNATSFAVPTSNVEVKIAPNPVTNIARISYELPEEGTTQVSVFDLKGNRISVIASGYQASGIHTVDFDASNLAGGFYYLTVQTANTQVTERMVIVK